MARDGLFFRSTGLLSERGVPARALVLQGVWASLLVLPRIRLHDASGAVVRDRGDRRAALRQPLQQSARVRRLRRAGVLRADHRGDLRAAAHATPRRSPVPRARLSDPAGALHRGRLGDRVVLFLYRTETTLPGPSHRAERAAGVRAVAHASRSRTRHDDTLDRDRTTGAATHAAARPTSLLASVRELAPAIARALARDRGRQAPAARPRRAAPRRSGSSACSCRDAGAVSRSTFRRASRSWPSSRPRTARWAGPR